MKLGRSANFDMLFVVKFICLVDKFDAFQESMYIPLLVASFRLFCFFLSIVILKIRGEALDWLALPLLAPL